MQFLKVQLYNNKKMKLIQFALFLIFKWKLGLMQLVS